MALFGQLVERHGAQLEEKVEPSVFLPGLVEVDAVAVWEEELVLSHLLQLVLPVLVAAVRLQGDLDGVEFIVLLVFDLVDGAEMAGSDLLLDVEGLLEVGDLLGIVVHFGLG